MSEKKESMYGIDIDCQYIDKCCDYPRKCNTCKHNKSKRRSYYEPDTYEPGYPYIPVWFDDNRVWCHYGLR